MIAAIALAGCCILLFGPMPMWLSGAAWTLRAPRASVFLWQAMGLAGCLAAIGCGLAVAVAPLHGSLPVGVARMIGRAASGHPLAHLGLNEALGLTVAADVALVLTAGLLVTVARSIRGRARHRLLLDLVASPCDKPEVVIVDDPRPVAYCLPGLRGRIVLSAGTFSLLDSPELDAVIAHEHGHTHARHDLVILPFASMVDLLRWMPYARRAPREVAMLLEMAADDFAGRKHGRRTVANALVRLTAAGAVEELTCSFNAAGFAVVHRVRRLLAEIGNSRMVAAAAIATSATVIAAPLAVGLLPEVHL